MNFPKIEVREFVDLKFVRRVFKLASLLFILFLISRFAGIAFFPEWRILNLLILLLALFSPIFLKTKKEITITVESPLTYMTASVSAYAVFTLFFFWYLKADPWFADFIDAYSRQQFNGSLNDFGFLMLAEGLQFSVIIALVGFFLRFHFADKRISTQ